MPFISSVGHTYRLQNVPKQPTLPANVLIPYYGSAIPSSDWVKYSLADGQFIRATVSQADIGVITYGNPASITMYSTSSGGDHGGQTFTTTISNTTGGNMYQLTSSGGGNHNHGVGASYSLAIRAATQNVMFLRSVKTSNKLPSDALVFKANSTGISSAQSFISSGPRYLVGSGTNLTATPAVTFANAGGKTGTSGGHYHWGQSGIYKMVTNTGYMMSQNNTFAGDHFHTTSAAYSQTKINSQLYNLWKLVVATSPVTDMILMYVGRLSDLPSPWYLCNGENGTVDIRNTIVGYSDGNTWGNVVVADGQALEAVVSTNTEIHTHSSGYNISAALGAAGFHINYAWNHNHTINISTGQYSPASINVAFIQYKG